MQKSSKLALAIAATFFAGIASAQVTLYGNEGMRGRGITITGPTSNLEGSNFNDRASSMVVQRGQWEVCEDSNFRGDCRILRPGQYPSLAAIGLGNEISSIRPLRGKAKYAYGTPATEPPRYEYYPRHDERLYQADVTAVRAVGGGGSEQRCWVERERVSGVGGYSANQIGGAVVGGILGGVLGHQIGGGRGQDVATALGAVGGAAVGANVAGGSSGYTQDVQRCETVPTSFQPAYYDVTYVFRGQQHRAQLASPPGQTIAVNGKGEPRV